MHTPKCLSATYALYAIPALYGRYAHMCSCYCELGVAEYCQAGNRLSVWLTGWTVTWMECVELHFGFTGNVLRVRSELRYLLLVL